MSDRMNYSPRFRSSAVSVGHHYDERVDEASRKDRIKMKAMMEHQPKYKQELFHYKGAESSKKRAAAVRNNNHRYEAEQRMEEAVRKAVAMLEFHMNDLMEHRYTATRPMLVNQNSIHNVIVLLRKKCGVTFENDLHYDHRIDLAVGGGCETVEQKSERVREEMRQQKIYRDRNMKEMAERFKKYREAHNGNRNGK